MCCVQQAKPAEFEDVLLSYADMCYSVALALTRNPRHAQELGREAYGVWRMRDNADGRPTIKQDLLKALREGFFLHYRQYPRRRGKTATSADQTVGTAQVADNRDADLVVRQSPLEGWAGS